MHQDDLMDLLVLMKKQYNKLCEVLDITKQLAEALDRRDQVSVQLLITMRQEPIDALEQVKKSLEAKRASLNDVDSGRLAALQAGATASGQHERMIAEQTGTNQRVFERLIALDRRVSHNLGGKESFYGG